jgi:hypothetical protein
MDLIPEAGTQQQEEQQGLVEEFDEWMRELADDAGARFEYLLWQHEALTNDLINAIKQEQNMVMFSAMGTSKFLKKEDLEGPTLVTIKDFKRVNVAQEGEEPENKWTVYFEEFEKPMVMNSTNRAIMEKVCGPDTDDAVGKSLVLYVDDNISFGGKLVGGLRLRAKKEGAAKPAKKKPAPQGVDEDDIPF